MAAHQPDASRPATWVVKSYPLPTSVEGQQLVPRHLDLPTLIAMAVGDWTELADHQHPPALIAEWLAEADIRQIRGLLLAALERWHQVV